MRGFSSSDITRAIIMNGVVIAVLYVTSFLVFPAQTLTTAGTAITFLFIWIGLFAYDLFHLSKRRQRLALGGRSAQPSLVSQQRMKVAFSAPAIVFYSVVVAGVVAALKYF